MKRVLKEWGGLILLLVGFLASAAWVFFRSGPLGSDRPIVIRIAHWQIEKGPPAGIDAMIKRYEELNPRVRVEQVMIPGTIFIQWARSNFTAGEGPDLVEYGIWLQGMSDIPPRYFAPITEELMKPNPYNRGTPLEGVPWIKTFLPGFEAQLATAPDPGQYYAVPITDVSFRIFVNRALFKEVFGDMPLPTTFQDLRDLSARLQKDPRRRAGSLHLFAGSRDNAYWLMESLLQSTMVQQSYAMDRDGLLTLYPRQTFGAYLEGRWRYDEPRMLAGLELVREMGGFMRPGFLQLTRDQALQEFMRGDAVFIGGGTWDATSFKTLATFPIGVFRLPQPTKSDPVAGKYSMGRVYDGGGVGAMAFYLNRYSHHREQALDFMRFMTSVPGAQLFTDASGWLPMVRDVKIAPDIAPFQAQYDGYANGGAYSILGTDVPQAFLRNMHLIYTGPDGPERFAKAMDATMPAAMRADLEAERRKSEAVVRPQDVRIVGSHFAALESGDPQRYKVLQEQLETTQADGEAAMLQMQVQLRAAPRQP
ncbi:extracellular solute-binding protein [Horticoccus luteus]|uniref:Extracellular solute-binding protein n=1 Tax=Horticoccus luteus TaxID=2862869 RepID=A0A8F9XK55_9BACT|nr:extracellular solute-binding protein [Horticoccus luteus]QYM79358.1 extracellular solute-binding protein [Horticoccus luteus]